MKSNSVLQLECFLFFLLPSKEKQSACEQCRHRRVQESGYRRLQKWHFQVQGRGEHGGLREGWEESEDCEEIELVSDMLMVKMTEVIEEAVEDPKEREMEWKGRKGKRKQVAVFLESKTWETCLCEMG